MASFGARAMSLFGRAASPEEEHDTATFEAMAQSAPESLGFDSTMLSETPIVFPSMVTLNPMEPPMSVDSLALDANEAKLQEKKGLVGSTGIVYDTRMMLHRVPVGDHPERPERIAKIFDLLEQHGLVARMVRVPAREALRSEVELVHESHLWSDFERLVALPPEELAAYNEALDKSASLYLNSYSTLSARISCGSVIEISDWVITGKVRNGLAVVRPPGHHAEPQSGTGFCLFNNVAVAAQSMLERFKEGPHRVQRIMIVDWDVHHGNGTQKAFWNNKDVLYVSLHRYENGTFYPCTHYGNYDQVGGPGALGTSLNIPWPCKGMGDADYMCAFQKCIMPVAYEYAPDLVIVSAGFDAALGDQLGECCVTPAGYAHMTHQLAALANGRMVVALEGGYNLTSISNSALAVAQTLLGEAPPMLAPQVCSSAAASTVETVIRVQAPYWDCLAATLPYMPCAPPKALEIDPRAAMAVQRSSTMWERYNMVNLPAKGPHQAPFAPNQILCSRSVMSADVSVLVLYVHDNGPLHYRDPYQQNAPGDPSTFVVESTCLVADWAAERGFAYVDFNTLAMFPARNWESSNQIAAVVPQDTPQEQSVFEQLQHTWANFVSLSPAKHIVLIGQGTGCKATMRLVSDAKTQRRVTAVVQVMGYNPVPHMYKPRALKQWYYDHSLVLCPNHHPFCVLGEHLGTSYRPGCVVQSGEANAEALLWTDKARILDFIAQQLDDAADARRVE
ncbi:Hda1p [Malassezia vespertilionis]|uniref:histone deacetylase n=1 Tax=Malassezia vespertilionis TaxID=2020962 RepID=A0A2N1JGV3_9BASI|nr:Hda1p [Malassezia vespertilionis]